MLRLPLISYLLKMGIRQLPCKVKTRFPSQVIDLLLASSPELEAQMHETQKISTGRVRNLSRPESDT